ncbi:O-antigen ligase family protein [Halovivax cerinus]|uniref:O-antigen ligase family protein n=1 Tax=Halovivax cerinus TaxID=1487865 RepID=A0ABD5NM28_9EURY|nr:O-antigen ligase family protein [Halovivax cerinus]
MDSFHAGLGPGNASPSETATDRRPFLVMLVAFSLFPSVYVGADRLAVVESLSPVNPYYVVIVGATVAAVLAFFRDGDRYSLSLLVLLAAVAFVAWATLSLQWTVGTGAYPRYKLVRMIVFDTLLLWFGLVVALSRRRLVAFGLVMGLVGAWLAAEAVYAGTILETDAFATVGSESYLTHGRAIGFAVPLCLYVFGSSARFAVRLLAGVLALAGIVGVLAAGGRGPFVALVVALAVFVGIEFSSALFDRRTDRRGVFAAGGATATVTVAAVLVVRAAGWTPWTIRRLVIVFRDSATETRLFMLREAFGFWLERPLVGHGIGSYAVLTETVHEYPHNVVVETLAELGLVGFALACLVVVPPVVVTVLARFRGGDALYSAALAVFVFAFVNACFSFDLQSNRQLFFAIGLLSIAWTDSMREPHTGVADVMQGVTHTMAAASNRLRDR